MKNNLEFQLSEQFILASSSVYQWYMRLHYESKESIGDILDVFKRHLKEHCSNNDPDTHYDIDNITLEQFHRAVRICSRESPRDTIELAYRWYAVYFWKDGIHRAASQAIKQNTSNRHKLLALLYREFINWVRETHQLHVLQENGSVFLYDDNATMKTFIEVTDAIKNRHQLLNELFTGIKEE